MAHAISDVGLFACGEAQGSYRFAMARLTYLVARGRDFCASKWVPRKTDTERKSDTRGLPDGQSRRLQ